MDTSATSPAARTRASAGLNYILVGVVVVVGAIFVLSGSTSVPNEWYALFKAIHVTFAVIWIGGRPAYLKDFLRANGVPNAFATYVNTGEITGITPDGHILVGWGAAALGFRGYIVVLGSSLVIP